MPEDRLKSLFLRAVGGDAAACQAFFRELAGHLHAFLRWRLARRPEDVEDLVQETLLAVHRQRHAYDPAQPLTPWIHALARHKLVDFLRRHARMQGLQEPLDEESEELAVAAGAAAEARRDLARLLEGLPARQRLPIVYVKIEGRTVAETAQATGLSPSAVKIGVHRGLKALAARR